jgi:type I restriction enzyme R subunit
MVISDKEDQLIGHTRGYGKGQAPEDYLSEFNDFIHENLNKLVALQIVCTRPRDLTRESLKSLKLELDRHNFTEKQLNTAWKEWKNEDIAADIISFIRRSALGSALIAHDERIRQALAKLRNNHNFNKMQQDWLDRIEKSLLAETIIDHESFESGAFKTAGGFQKINKVFAGQLDDYLHELNNYLYDDGGTSA